MTTMLKPIDTIRKMRFNVEKKMNHSDNGSDEWLSYNREFQALTSAIEAMEGGKPAEENGCIPDEVNIKLPFFAYGIFKPGELAYLQLREFIAKSDSFSIKGSLRLRDGIPILDVTGNGSVSGTLLYFMPGRENEAYGRISKMEPLDQYKWEKTDDNRAPANYLAGKSPKKGSHLIDDYEWIGEKDPFFTVALDVVKKTLKASDEFNLERLLGLEMAYLLLWSAIERYCSFRYGLGKKVTKNIEKMADDPAFGKAVHPFLEETRTSPLKVYKADRPKESETFSAGKYKNIINYYYQIRCNAAHRGKSAVQDHETLKQALIQMLEIFGKVLTAAFEESRRPLH